MAAFAVSSIPVTLLSKVAAPIIHFIIDGRRSNPMSSFGDGDDGSRQGRRFVEGGAATALVA